MIDLVAVHMKRDELTRAIAPPAKKLDPAQIAFDLASSTDKAVMIIYGYDSLGRLVIRKIVQQP